MTPEDRKVLSNLLEKAKTLDSKSTQDRFIYFINKCIEEAQKRGASSFVQRFLDMRNAAKLSYRAFESRRLMGQRLAATAATVHIPDYALEVLLQLGLENLDGWDITVAPGALHFKHIGDYWVVGDSVFSEVRGTIQRYFKEQPTQPQKDEWVWRLNINDRQVYVNLRISTGCKERTHYTSIEIM
jgi:hypothetical protein